MVVFMGLCVFVLGVGKKIHHGLLRISRTRMGLRTVEQVSQSASSTLLRLWAGHAFFGIVLQVLPQAVGILANKEIPFSHFSPIVDRTDPALGGRKFRTLLLIYHSLNLEHQG